MAAEPDRDGTAPDDAVGREIVGRETPAALADGRGDRLRELAAVERPPAPGRDRLERVREVRQAERVAGDEPRPGRAAVDPPRLVGVADDRVEHRVEVRLRACELHTAPCELDRGCEQLLPWEAPIGPVNGFQAGRGPRDGDRRRADQKRLRGAGAGAEVDLDRVHLSPARPPQAEAGRRDEEVGDPRRPPAGVDEHEAARSRARQVALGDGGREACGDAGVDRVAALLERLRAGTGGQRVSRGDCPLHVQRLISQERGCFERVGAAAAGSDPRERPRRAWRRRAPWR